MKKGGVFHSTDPVADVARAGVACGTRVDAMRHARPRGRAAQAHVRRSWRIGHGHVAGGHAGPRGRPGGAMWQRGWQVKGPRVSGPW